MKDEVRLMLDGIQKNLEKNNKGFVFDTDKDGRIAIESQVDQLIKDCIGNRWFVSYDTNGNLVSMRYCETKDITIKNSWTPNGNVLHIDITI